LQQPVIRELITRCSQQNGFSKQESHQNL
jgi:hypothetical protein